MERLISQARKGDPDAFTALMESQMQNMYKAATVGIFATMKILRMLFQIRFWCAGKNFPS